MPRHLKQHVRKKGVRRLTHDHVVLSSSEHTLEKTHCVHDELEHIVVALLAVAGAAEKKRRVGKGTFARYHARPRHFGIFSDKTLDMRPPVGFVRRLKLLVNVHQATISSQPA